ncbi:MAG: ribulose-phosphate 3-epimerase [Myxococcales bacterium]|nr:ribulose-phosphate 3-epimerase [Myxococcales bacterium]
MGTQVLVAPSILSADFGWLAEEVRSVERGGADWIHVDVMDGHFVPNLTIGPAVVEAVHRATKLPLDVHLMIAEPERFVPEFVRAGASLVSVHVEACPHLHRVLQLIRQLGAKPAVALNPATPLSAVEEALGEVEMVLLMSVDPGFGGQGFIPAAVEKVRRLRGMLDARGLRVQVEVDGGINERTGPEVVAAGATVLVAGSYIFGAADYPAAIASLRP